MTRISRPIVVMAFAGAMIFARRCCSPASSTAPSARSSPMWTRNRPIDGWVQQIVDNPMLTIEDKIKLLRGYELRRADCSAPLPRARWTQ